ncbi:BsuPI-related putative proteinase inhibitor [Halobacillus naozhouensis]|uniref:Intracellular proteinase inhibitor BsuPI domain-containing protein n=1 Tax=Halobacillus naozhouensis TaxID=554880 RepID=A0ABY8J1P3_9BACI|nr:BsuPI-related putative proteinase inhibitor [Halobacillus naozhouensis]WFT75492.1 BsuPI-related putative proteinase inhibitor [Halobacillus naozhouensis]
MRMILLLAFLLFAIILSSCGQQNNNQTDSANNANDDKAEEVNGDKENSNGSQEDPEGDRPGGIIAGKLETTLEVSGHHAYFQIKNQTERVQKLVISGKTAYNYIIADDEGNTVFENAKSQPQYEPKKPITLKQAEEIEYKLSIPEDLEPGTYSITAILHTEPVLKAKTSFNIE